MLPSSSSSSSSSSSAFPTTGECAPLLAGYFSGTLGLIVGHPLDSARVWIQSQSTVASAPLKNLPSSSAATSNNARFVTLPRVHLVRPDKAQSAARLSAFRANSSAGAAAAANAVQRRPLPTKATNIASLSVRNLYRGIAGPLATVGCIQGVGFATYDYSRKTIKVYRGQDGEDPLQDVALAAFATGGLVSVITAPLITIKIRQQLSGSGFWNVVRDAFNMPKGIRNLYAGYSAHFGLEALGRATFFACYEGLKREMIQYHDNDDISTLALSQRMAAAAFSGIVSTSILLPLDAIRTRIHSRQASPIHGIPTLQQASTDLWQMGGARAFFRGYGAALVRAGPVASLSMPAYDLALEWLQN